MTLAALVPPVNSPAPTVLVIAKALAEDCEVMAQLVIALAPLQATPAQVAEYEHDRRHAPCWLLAIGEPGRSRTGFRRHHGSRSTTTAWPGGLPCEMAPSKLPHAHVGSNEQCGKDDEQFSHGLLPTPLRFVKLTEN